MTKPQPPPALAIGGNGPATAAWAVWQAIGRCYICQTQGLPVVLGDSGDVS